MSDKIFEQIGTMLELQIVEGDAKLVTKQEDLLEPGSPVQKIEPVFKLRMVFREKENVAQVVTDTLDLEQARILAKKIIEAADDFERKVEETLREAIRKAKKK